MAPDAAKAVYCEFDPAEPGPYEAYLLPQVIADARRGAGGWSALGAAWGRYALGAAALAPDRDDPEALALASLYVDPQARNRGLGSALLRRAAEAAKRRGAARLTLSYILAGEELEAMDRAVRSLGAEPEFYLPVYTVDAAEFRDSPLVGRAFRSDYVRPGDVVRFADLAPEQRAALDADPEVPWYVAPRRRVRMQTDLSLALLREGRVTAFWLGCETAPGSYAVQGVWRGASAPVTAFHTLLNAHLNLCFYHGGGYFLYHCSPAVEFADALIQRYTGGRYRRLEEHRAAVGLRRGE